MAMKLYVGNLSYETSEEGLRSTFGRYGTVESASVITDRDTGRSKGFAFVEMSAEDEGKAAISALDGSDLDGRSIKVSEARPQERRTGGRGNTGGRSFGGRRY